MLAQKVKPELFSVIWTSGFLLLCLNKQESSGFLPGWEAVDWR
jgi:hypothetical protein